MKKRILCMLLALSLLLTLAAAAGCGASGPATAPDTTADGTDPTEEDELTEDDDPTDTGDVTDAPAPTETAVKIRAAATAQPAYETYDNGLVRLQIPQGWQVEAPQVDYIHYCFKVYDPADTRYIFTFNLKLEGFLKSETARSTFAKLYPDATFSKLAAVDPQTTEGFYRVWRENAQFSNANEFGYAYFPLLNDFTVIENLGAAPLGGDVLRASFTNDAGDAMQGLFTASVTDAGSYYMYGADLAPLNVYHVIMMMAPDAEFVNWQPIMDRCIGSIAFSEAFLNGFAAEEQQLAATIRANQQIYDEISDMIMDSWAQRSASYDIISQKRSDATLGYERVYDTETGDVYRAYNGFTDAYAGSRYRPVTDDMYTAAISGYIDK